MATGKRYYWIKLRDSFFTSDTVDFFMSQPNGAQYIVLYQMLHLLTANTGGKLQRQIGEVIIPYDVAKITRDCKWFSEDTVRVALELYKQFGLIYEAGDHVLMMTDHGNMVGSETDYASQKRLQRAETKELQGAQRIEEIGKESVDTVHSDVHTDVHDNVHASVHTDIRDKRLDTRDKSIDIRYQNIESDIAPAKKGRDRSNATPHGFFENVMITDEEYGKLVKEFGAGMTDYTIDDLSNALQAESTPYKYKDHYAALRNWIKRNVGRKLKPIPIQKTEEQKRREDENPFG